MKLHKYKITIHGQNEYHGPVCSQTRLYDPEGKRVLICKQKGRLDISETEALERISYSDKDVHYAQNIINSENKKGYLGLIEIPDAVFEEFMNSAKAFKRASKNLATLI